MKKILILLVSLIVLSSFVLAIDLPVARDKYVNDFAGVFDVVQTGQLRGLLMAVEQNTTAEFVMTTIEQCAPYTSSQYATELLNGWKVGKADKNNGFVVVYCKAENKIFAATGYGLEGILPDSKIGRFLDENYVLLRDSGNVSEGIIRFVEVVSQEMIDNAEEIRSGQAGAGNNGLEMFIIVLFLILLLRRIAGFFLSKNKAKKNGFGWWILPLFIPSRSSGGFGGYSGFGGGFGGGGGGGGGAGR